MSNTNKNNTSKENKDHSNSPIGFGQVFRKSDWAIAQEKKKSDGKKK